MLKIILAPSMSCTASAGRHLGKIPLFPPLPKGDETGIFFAAFASLRETFRASVAASPRWVFVVNLLSSLAAAMLRYAMSYLISFPAST
jgi:hypothetical protein